MTSSHDSSSSSPEPDELTLALSRPRDLSKIVRAMRDRNTEYYRESGGVLTRIWPVDKAVVESSDDEA